MITMTSSDSCLQDRTLVRPATSEFCVRPSRSLLVTAQSSEEDNDGSASVSARIIQFPLNAKASSTIGFNDGQRSKVHHWP